MVTCHYLCKKKKVLSIICLHRHRMAYFMIHKMKEYVNSNSVYL